MLSRPTPTFETLEPLVEEVFSAVKQEGDAAIKSYTSKFDKVTLTDFSVSSEEISMAIDAVPAELKRAISLAKSNIEKFHEAQRTNKVSVETMPGVVCWQEKRPIQKVGLYIPGGTAPLFSTILMLAVPAKIAGCDELFGILPQEHSVPEHYTHNYNIIV